jgi:cysteine-rich repeat protein
LTKTAPAGAVTTTGTDISVSLTAQNTQNISVGEIVVEFDQAVLEGKAIVESSSIIALNKSINNTTGKITVDISLSGPGSFTADSNLVNFIFTAKTLAQSSTTVKIGTTSTFGIPNKIATDGFGTLSIPIQLPTAVCGNSKIESNEQCDDGNLVNNDGCSSICRTETAATSCGDGTVQKPNSAGVIEICDDGNTSNADSCSNNCLNSCTSPKIWNGSTCRNPLAVGCKGDYNATGTVDISDFQILAQNYRTNGITCNLDISGSPCYLDINDFSEFAKIYKQNNQCKL